MAGRPVEPKMSAIELLLIAVGLAMDAFAVAIGKGLCCQRLRTQYYLKTGLWFGGFQALMPLVGYYLGVRFASYVTHCDHWIAFLLLAFIGGNMIKEALKKEEAPSCEVVDFGFKTMLLLAIATSIDALAVGVSFAFLQVEIAPAVLIIGLVTFFIAASGLKIGHIFGALYKKKAEFAGGLLLVVMGVKILAEHLTA